MKRFAILAIFVVVLVMVVSVAYAATVLWSGTLTDQPDIVNADLGGCAAGTRLQESYDVVPFYVGTSGAYDITITAAAGMPSVADDSLIALYSPGFAGDWPTNCVAVNDDNVGWLSGLVGQPLTANTQYELVVTYAYQGGGNGIGATYDAQITGPGSVCLGLLGACDVTPPAEEEEELEPVPGPDMVDLPTGSVVGAVVADTPVYFAPEAGAATDIIIEAGKTLWVIERVDGFYKVVLSGKFFYLPVGSMGPNYDEVWNGTPLP